MKQTRHAFDKAMELYEKGFYYEAKTCMPVFFGKIRETWQQNIISSGVKHCRRKISNQLEEYRGWEVCFRYLKCHNPCISGSTGFLCIFPLRQSIYQTPHSGHESVSAGGAPDPAAVQCEHHHIQAGGAHQCQGP